MTESTAPWVSALRDHTAREKPAPARETFTEMEEWQCRIVGGALIAWLQHHGPRILQERAVLANTLEVDDDPMVVFTSDAPGLAAAREILDGSPAPVIVPRASKPSSPRRHGRSSASRRHCRVDLMGFGRSLLSSLRRRRVTRAIDAPDHGFATSSRAFA